jgi:hypothetical protein
MPNLSPQLEAFAQRRALALFNGETQKESYEQIWGLEGDTSRKSAAIACKPQVKLRIAQIGKEALAIQKKVVALTLKDSLDFLSSVLLARPSQASADNPLCEMKMSKQGPYYVFPPKLEALNLLSKLQGWTQELSLQIKLPGFDQRDQESVTEAIEAEVVQETLPDAQHNPEPNKDHLPVNN